jgi:hypothetical protein
LKEQAGVKYNTKRKEKAKHYMHHPVVAPEGGSHPQQVEESQVIVVKCTQASAKCCFFYLFSIILQKVMRQYEVIGVREMIRSMFAPSKLASTYIA